MSSNAPIGHRLVRSVLVRHLFEHEKMLPAEIARQFHITPTYVKKILARCADEPAAPSPDITAIERIAAEHKMLLHRRGYAFFFTEPK